MVQTVLLQTVLMGLTARVQRVRGDDRRGILLLLLLLVAQVLAAGAVGGFQIGLLANRSK